jgi:hypothetical protein
MVMRKLAATLLVGLLAGCAVQPPAPREAPAAEAPPGFPEAYYRQAAAQGMPVLRVDPKTSIVAIEVYRSGSLARLGHDHVVASHDVRGYVAPRENRADLYVRLDALVVDEPDLRKQAGFDTQPTDEDIAGTRRNMLASLEAQAFPYALIHLAGAGEPGSLAGTLVNKVDKSVDVTITVHGVERKLRAPVALETSAGSLVATGRIALKQTDFGVTPLSVLGGAIQVKDDLNVRFTIRAATVE